MIIDEDCALLQQRVFTELAWPSTFICRIWSCKSLPTYRAVYRISRHTRCTDLGETSAIDPGGPIAVLIL